MPDQATAGLIHVLVWKDEDEDVGAFDRLQEIRFGDDVLRELDPRKVFRIFVRLIDEFTQLPTW